MRATRQVAKKFIIHETEHFIIRYEEGADEVLLLYAKEVLEKSYRVLGEILEYYPQDKILIEIYPER